MEKEKQHLDGVSKWASITVILAAILLFMSLSLFQSDFLIRGGVLAIFVGFIAFCYVAIRAFLANRKYQTKDFTSYYWRVIIALVIATIAQYFKNR